MGVRRLGIVMYGVTGRVGLNQHLVRSIVAIRDHGKGVGIVSKNRRHSYSIRPTTPTLPY